MTQEQTSPPGPDLTQGVALADFVDGRLVGHVGKEEVLLVRAGSELFAIGAHCTHYHGPLADGLVTGKAVRCPWHHACFDLRTGEALRAPALSPVECWTVEQRDGRDLRQGKARAAKTAGPAHDKRGRTNRDCRRRCGRLCGGRDAAATRLSAAASSCSATTTAPPVDRPNLSKDYLAGSAPEDWVPLRPDELLCRERHRPASRVRRSPASTRRRAKSWSPAATSWPTTGCCWQPAPTGAAVDPGRRPAARPYAALARRLPRHHRARQDVHAGRSCIGASFIGLEVAASLRARDIEVHVVAPEKRPMERVLGPQMGDFVRALHEEHGVIFHLRDTATAIDGAAQSSRSGGALEADLVVVGVGVRPRLAWPNKAGLTVDRGVAVDAYLETSAARHLCGGRHCALARSAFRARTSASSIGSSPNVRAKPRRSTCLGQQRDDLTPCHSSGASTTTYRSTMSATPSRWDEIAIDGDISAKDCLLRYKRNGRVLAVASIFRDVENLQAELAMERAVAQ